MTRKNSGFTMTELMVTIAIISIVTSIAVPNFLGWLPKYRLSSASRNILSAIEFTRLTAVRQYADAQIQFNVGNSSYTVSVNGRTVKGDTLPAGVSIASSFSGNNFDFNRQGFPDESGNVTLSGDSGSKVINVKVSGNARIQ
jgi:type IV fimbrial biogenesis protein FimT